MKIAIPTKGTIVDDHFGHCAFYTVFTVENNKVVNTDKVDSNQTCGCKSGVVNVLKEQGVGLMLVGNIGQGAINVIKSKGIELIRGCSGDVNQLINNYLDGKIKDAFTVCAEHSNEGGQGHNCNH